MHGMEPAQERLKDRIPLRRGAHPSREDGLCTMELVAWLAGEPHSDEPRCACPVLAAFVRTVNDSVEDQDRERLLRPLAPLLVNSRADAAVEQARGMMLLDVLVREVVPAWLRARGRRHAAAGLAALPEVGAGTSVAEAAAALAEAAPDLRPAQWTVRSALAGMAPARFAPGVALAARQVGRQAIWGVAQRIVLRATAGPRAVPV
ncbi:MAG: hypothetical protein RL398_2240 [Planctomycetota bacterium]|jgi:hypothetical protein